MNKIVLQDIIIDGSLVKYKFLVNQEMKRFFNTETMFLRYEHNMTDVPLSILSIPFVNCMAGLSWLTGAMLFVDEIDETYYYAFKQLKVAYSELHDTSLSGMFVPSIIRKNEIPKNDQYLLLFGGGVDCHSSYLRNRDRVSAVINIFGWSRNMNDFSEIDESDKKSTKSFADRFGINSFHVSTNFASQFNHKEIDNVLCRKLHTSYWYGFLHSMAFLAISAPIAWLNKCSNLMIASSFSKDRVDVHCGSYITTDSEFIFATNGTTVHDGFELNRQEKVKLLVDYQKTQVEPYFLHACSFNEDNCCECSKCLRTIYELAAEGADPRAYGFNRINGSLQEHIETQIERNIHKLKIEKYYYHLTKQRMRQNYENIQDKEFVDWFLVFNFDKAKRKGLIKYYRKNFLSILKRKIHTKSIK